ncbi:MAG: hypothetical protein KKE11_05975 [Gammaproteobacteria bacterium]|nr:hypothetical protein [Gammaproteobacteria bacterium]
MTNISELNKNEISAISGGTLAGTAGSFIGLGVFAEAAHYLISNNQLPQSTAQRYLILSAAGLATQYLCSWTANFLAAIPGKVFSSKQK